MKTHNKTVKIALLLGIAAWTLSACQDWLTVYPTNQVVEENFWEDKNDLEGVRYAAYQQMCKTMRSLILWGDLRSDSYSLYSTSDNSTKSLWTEIRDGRIERDSANAYFDWSGVYRTINYCNKVLQHGAEVLERDKQFTSAEWQQMKAEITGLRALNYFYLIRAFKDIPFSTKVINKDTEVQYFYATNQLIVLDSLITDLENVKGQARNRFSTIRDTKGLITNPAIYAMLSDMYLWRAALHEGRGMATDSIIITNVPAKVGTKVIHTVKGDYQLAADYADLALAALAEQNNHNNLSISSSRTLMINYGLENCYMYKNDFSNFANGSSPRLSAFASIFGGNSEESIFELQFSQSEGRSHDMNKIWSYDRSSNDNTRLATSEATLSKIYNSNANMLPRDSRLWIAGWNKGVDDNGGVENMPERFCFKWSGGDYSLKLPASNKCEDIAVIPEPDQYSNWIIYRLSDVMLQKAEALVALGKEGDAMRYVNAIHRRWYCNDNTSNTEQPNEDVTGASGAVNQADDNANKGNLPKATNFEIAVLNERQLEFLGEGKRWFDLVRYAERHAGGTKGKGLDEKAWNSPYPKGTTNGTTRAQYFPEAACELAGTNSGIDGIEKMLEDLMSGEWDVQKRKTLRNRFKNRYGLYNLIYYKEIEATNGENNKSGNHLEQNPVWNKSLYDD